MRRVAALAAALGVVLAVAAIAWAQQQNTYSVTASISPSKKGSKAKPLPVGQRKTTGVRSRASFDRPFLMGYFAVS